MRGDVFEVHHLAAVLPAGMAIAGIVYNYDRTVHASDEGRMLAEMGDRTFCLGSLDIKKRHLAKGKLDKAYPAYIDA
jgi:hypothetical protein